MLKLTLIHINFAKKKILKFYLKICKITEKLPNHSVICEIQKIKNLQNHVIKTISVFSK